MSTTKDIYLRAIKRILTSLSPLILALMFSCTKGPGICLKPAGSRTEELRQFAPFHYIELHDNIDLILVDSSDYSGAIRTGSNLLGSVRTEVIGDTLILEDLSRCRWSRGYDNRNITIALYSNAIRGVKMYGGGNITVDDTLHGDLLEIQAFESGGNIDLLVSIDTIFASVHTGPCDITVKGISTVSSAYSAGNGKIDLRKLKANDSYVNNSGTNSIYVWAENYLDAQIFSIGDVYYKGTPTITGQSSGDGEVLPLN